MPPIARGMHFFAKNTVYLRTLTPKHSLVGLVSSAKKPDVLYSSNITETVAGRHWLLEAASLHNKHIGFFRPTKEITISEKSVFGIGIELEGGVVASYITEPQDHDNIVLESTGLQL